MEIIQSIIYEGKKQDMEEVDTSILQLAIYEIKQRLKDVSFIKSVYWYNSSIKNRDRVISCVTVVFKKEKDDKEFHVTISK